MDFAAQRAGLVAHLGTEIRDKRVLAAMSRVPREQFVPAEVRHQAYEDRPLPIGLEQTISQPYIIALMTEALELAGGEKVLEVGTGSGYQTALLAGLAARVITVERLAPLMAQARMTLDGLGYRNIEFHPAGKELGWPPEAPYEAIIVTAAAPRVPAALMRQLAVGGRMMIPVGSRYLQELTRITRGEKNNRVQNLGGCRFVSLIGEEAWEEESS
ncbi:MAG: protein-L-isoaspartate(D-aspartate) O-methyltransferase [Chloroflexota bacterium]